MTDRSTIQLLRRMTVYDITRDGPTCSVMVRAGLLLDIIDLALASVDRNPEGEDPQGLSAKHESAVSEAETLNRPNPPEEPIL